MQFFGYFHFENVARTFDSSNITSKQNSWWKKEGVRAIASQEKIIMMMLAKFYVVTRTFIPTNTMKEGDGGSKDLTTV